MARRGTARPGGARQGGAGLGLARQGTARRGRAGLGQAGQGEARRGKALSQEQEDVDMTLENQLQYWRRQRVLASFGKGIESLHQIDETIESLERQIEERRKTPHR